jgi:hypothetical protein
MEMVRWILVTILGLLGLLVAIGNWAIGLRTLGIIKLKSGERVSSWIPLIGGGLIAIAFLVYGDSRLASFWWLGFLLDFGCVPGFLQTAFFRFVAKHKKSND